MKEVLYQIAKFYHENYGENAREVVDRFRITDVELTPDGTVNVTLLRPGLFIGLRGENVHLLSDYLERRIHIIEQTDWVADVIDSYLFDMDYNSDGEGV